MLRFVRRIHAQSELIRRNLLQQNKFQTFVRRCSCNTNSNKQTNDSFTSSTSTSINEINNYHLEYTEFIKEVNIEDLIKVLNDFFETEAFQRLWKKHGSRGDSIEYVKSDFTEYCLEETSAQNKLYDIIDGAAQIDDLFPIFFNWTSDIWPEKSCFKDIMMEYYVNKIPDQNLKSDFLENIDLTDPSTWYQAARSKTRKIIFHAGPTNSGKTYRAMQRFLKAKTGIYCGPLRLLALEVFQKSNKMGTPCDLVTGEERQYGHPDRSEASHLSVTVEMAPINREFDVAIIDEIQMFRDLERGGSYTRALLGLNANEIHVCGEAGTKELLERLCMTTGDIIECHHYDRLTPLTVEDKALESLDQLRPGDCIVCFNQNHINTVSQKIELLGKEVALIYGSLPPNVKLAQAAKFNDPNHPCKIIVATDAIGMGLNLNIRRIIFYEMGKLSKSDLGRKTLYQPLTTSQVLQIAGRAGRFGTQWENGFVTTYKSKDLETLKQCLSQKAEPITKAGLSPTFDQIQFYTNNLPESSLSGVVNFFTSVCTLNHDLYFMCCTEDFKTLANNINDIHLPFFVRYVYCHAPIDPRKFACKMIKMFARQHSKQKPITWDFVVKYCEMPATLPKSNAELNKIVKTYEILHLYLWLSNRFEDMYPHTDQVRIAQVKLEKLIQKGMAQIHNVISKC